MEDFTGSEIMARRERLEGAAALLLGRLLFEFARFDVAVGLCVVWIDDGRDLESLTPRVEKMPLHERLTFVESVAQVRLRGDSSYEDYLDWIARANRARLQRNELVHGRWGIDAVAYEAVNILGLPTSEGQVEKRYSLSDLEQLLRELQDLQQLLWQLRKQKPL